MNRLLISFFLLFSMTAFGQIKLDGEFSNRDNYNDLRISFKEDSIFDYFSGNLYPVIGSGIYKVDDGILTLIFLDIDTPKNSFHIEDTICINTSDSVTINFLVMDYKEPIPYAVVSFFQNSKIINSSIANIDGVVSLNAFKKNQDIEIRAQYLGYKTFSYFIKPEKCMNFIINLIHSPFYTMHKGSRLKYRIKKYDGKKLVLREETFSAPNIELRKTETNKKNSGNKID
jgi:hypothetical protein